MNNVKTTVQQEYQRLVSEIQELLEISNEHAINFVAYPLPVLKKAVVTYSLQIIKQAAIDNPYKYLKGICNNQCTQQGLLPDESTIEKYLAQELTQTVNGTPTRQFYKPEQPLLLSPEFAYEEITKIYSVPLPKNFVSGTQEIIDWLNYRKTVCDMKIKHIEKKQYTTQQAMAIMHRIQAMPKMYIRINDKFIPSSEQPNPDIHIYVGQILYLVGLNVID
jgi:hypothetical protein